MLSRNLQTRLINRASSNLPTSIMEMEESGYVKDESRGAEGAGGELVSNVMEPCQLSEVAGEATVAGRGLN